ncbi:MAG: BON domain-containing protein [Gammaproteobacteria bacterium]|nr:BON domain-containing protein [Gammaproteobacteria bacterium]
MSHSPFFNRHTLKIFAAFGLVLSLSGCIPAAALVVGATAGGAVVYDKRSVSTISQDQESENRAGWLIRSAPELQKGTHIVLATFDHVLLLVGQTSTDEQRTTADQLVSGVKNVSRVYNEITVRQPTSSWQRSHDAWITTKIKTEMLTTGGMHSTQVKVITENSTVYLMGDLSPRQGELANNIARRVDGVKKVVDVFENPK